MLIGDVLLFFRLMLFASGAGVLAGRRSRRGEDRHVVGEGEQVAGVGVLRLPVVGV